MHYVLKIILLGEIKLNNNVISSLRNYYYYAKASNGIKV